MRCPVAGPLLLLFTFPALTCAAEPKRSTRSANRPVRVAAGNRFALDLYAQMSGKEGNLFLSPYSISTALSLVSAGARGDTFEQMKRTLRLKEDKVGENPFLQSSSKIQQRAAQTHQVRIVNALWVPKGQTFGSSFLKQAQTHGAVKQVDFTAGSDKVRQTINGWVEKQTSNHVKEVIRAGAVDQQTRLVLTNAIYFKGAWVNPFKKLDTKERTFRVAPDRSVKAPFMHQVGEFGYCETVGLQVLELPYAGKELRLIVLLPKKVDGLATLEKDLSAKRLDDCLRGLKPTGVAVALPRFRLSSEAKLNRPLAKMGMPLAFGPDADFSGIDKKGGLFLSAVFHKAFIDVNEEGTEAGASTAALVQGKSVAAPGRTVRANHPFVFLIIDKRSRILFLGRLVEPIRG